MCIVHDLDALKQEVHVCDRLVALREDRIDGFGTLTAHKQAELRGTMSAKPGLWYYSCLTSRGLPRLDRAMLLAEQHLDSKTLLEVERCWRDLGQF